MIRVPYAEVVETLVAVLHRLGLAGEDAALCARLFADASRDGVYSHGLHRFPRFVEMVKSGEVDVRGRAERTTAHGPIERWEGRHGPGNVNAYRCMGRAIELSREHGIGCVALANTSHWMRGGSYGWQAAETGLIGICWTNTMPNLPPWGSSEPRLGNNPLVVAVPRQAGPVVLDMAMSQFSFGALEAYRLRGEMLPVDGGFDAHDALTRDPAAIAATGRVLPAGYWKGSGLALVLDLLAAILSGGRATHEIPPDPLRESAISQVFIAIDPATLGPSAAAEETANRIIDDFLAARPSGQSPLRYPGERVLRDRRESLEAGVAVDLTVWNRIASL
ncbi:MAG: 3-dehydro-L-gulonate 2-dehydrogenase [Gemmatimonadetes bacterium]|nr:3-dehydro-L-gulonate 2-dehydrogenase [Gemmatimonadota bacterium]